jgi:hypothetical protein
MPTKLLHRWQTLRRKVFMRELNPIGRDQDQLLLSSSDGEKFSVPIDQTLLKTIKEEKLPDVSGEQLTPRQIQDAVRAGSTVAELAAASGGSVDLIERFAHPVIEELAHMVDLAKSIRIELPADRFNDVEKKPFGDVVEGKLRQTGATQIEWLAKRAENTVWEISVTYELNGAAGHATWTFDPRRYLLTPETANAASLSMPGVNLDSPLNSTPRPPEPQDDVSDSVVTADKLEAFRKRREQTEAIEPVIREVVEIEEVEVLEVLEELGEESQEAPPEAIAPLTPVEPKKSRPPMPSWDEIVRGTQSEDGDAF